MAVLQKTPCARAPLCCENRQRRTRGQQQQQQQPTRKHAMNTDGGSPTGTNDSMASGGRGARTTPKVQTAQRKTTMTAKRKPRGKNPNKTNQPKGEAHEGKATPKGVQVGKTNEPEGRQDQQQTNKHKSRTDKGPKNLLHTNQPSLHSINVTRLISNNPTIPRRQKLSRLGTLHKRRGQSQAICSNVPSSAQPSQMHMVEGR